MTSFLSLPLEVREMIYQLALVVGDVYPYYVAEREALIACSHSDSDSHCDYEHPKKPMPNVNILATCRLIHMEASPILYGKNIFTLPICSFTVKFFATALHTPKRQSWVKNVKLALTASDLTVQARKEIFAKETERLESRLTEHGRYFGHRFDWVECGRNVHGACKRKLVRELWPRKVECILDHLALDGFWLDFDSSHCGSRCCNLDMGALGAFNSGFAYGMPKLWYEKKKYVKVKEEKVPRAMVQEWTRLRKKKTIKLKEGLSSTSALIRWMRCDIRDAGEFEDNSVFISEVFESENSDSDFETIRTTR